MYDRWVQAADKGMISGIVFLDLSAAFDLVDSSLLVKKLEVYGLCEDVIMWIKSYLSNRKQAVWIDHVLSDWREVPAGVPQGSILGPLLFTIFSNDFPEVLSCDVDQYADDNTLSCVKPTIAGINLELNENCQKVSNWMENNSMCLNASKTHLMIAGTGIRVSKFKEEQINISMDGLRLVQSDDKSEKVLGVIVQSNLKWSKHIQDLQTKLKVRLAGIEKIRHVLSVDKRNTVAKAIFESVLTYCMAAWGGTSKREIENLQVLQNKAAQFVLNLPGRSSRDQMYKSLNWLTVYQLTVFHTVVAVHSIRRTHEPELLARKLSRENVRRNIVVQNTGLTLFRKSFVIRGAELWNRIPQLIRNIEDCQRFKKELKIWIQGNVRMFL